MKRKGFTLVELLAVIVILAVIALIATPMIMGLIKEARKEAFRDSVYGAFKQLEYYALDHAESLKEGVDVTAIGLRKGVFISGTFRKNVQGKIEVVNISDGKYCASGVKDDLEIVEGACDLTTPKCELKVEGEKGINHWYRENPKVTMKTSKASSGVLTYGIGISENYDNQVEVGEEGKAEYQTTGIGKLQVYCYVKNMNGEKGSSVVEVAVDTSEPEEVDFSTLSTTNSITVVARGKDSESGIVRYQFSKDNGTTWSEIGSSNMYTFRDLQAGSYQVKVRVYNGTYIESKKEDNLKKESETKVVKIKELDEPTYSANHNGWTNENVDVTIKYDGEIKLFKTTVPVISNMNAVKCESVNNGSYICNGEITRNIESGSWYRVEENPTLTFVENGSVIAQVIDGANYKMGSSFTVGNIDKASPTVKLGTATNTSNSITIPTIISDIESGVETVTCKYGTTDGSYTTDGVMSNESCVINHLVSGTTYYYQICAIDKAGNPATCETGNIATNALTVKVDFTSKPATAINGYVQSQIATISTTGNPTTYYVKTTREGVSNLASAESCGIGIDPGTCTANSTTILSANTWYSFTSKPSITYNQDSSSNGTIYVKVTDGTNMTVSATGTISKIDTTAPKMTYEGIDQSSFDYIDYEIDVIDSESGYSSATCKYGTANGVYNLTGRVSKYYTGDEGDDLSELYVYCHAGNLQPSTNYYFQTCVTDKLGNSACYNSTAMRTDDLPVSTVSYTSISENKANFTIRNSLGLSGYAITTSATTPSSYTPVSGTSATVSQSLALGTYYIHVKDIYSRVISKKFTITQGIYFNGINITGYTPQVWNISGNGIRTILSNHTYTSTKGTHSGTVTFTTPNLNRDSYQLSLEINLMECPTENTAEVCVRIDEGHEECDEIGYNSIYATTLSPGTHTMHTSITVFDNTRNFDGCMTIKNIKYTGYVVTLE